MQVLVTGVAGFIGYHVAKALLDDAIDVVGIDSLTPYYDVTLKEARLEKLAAMEGSPSSRAILPSAPCLMNCGCITLM